MADGRFISYLRVSTDRQGRSGLGEEAQREAVSRYLNGGSWTLLAEHVEVETGKGANALDRRPALKAALEQARKAKATLVIAKLDRLARNVAFISALMEAKVDFIAVDMPGANQLTLHIMAAFAEHEAKMISERTKVALAAFKAREAAKKAAGEPWRTLGANGRVLAAQHKAEAVDRLTGVAGLLADMKAEGLTVRQIAASLNDRGVPSPGGTAWQITTTQRALVRLGLAGAGRA